MQSEFYHLRRTAIKDLSAYCGFLLGFLGSAPLAWQLLSVQLDAGNFATGLWYFFGIVLAAGIFSGIAGLGIGFVVGLSWEQVHRYRRGKAALRKAVLESRGAPVGSALTSPARATVPAFIEPVLQEAPRLHLVSSPATLPELTGRRVASVRFLSASVEMDFGGVLIAIAGSPVITAGSRRFRYPEAGSRDALCALIGARVERMRNAPGDRVELRFDTGWELVIPRPGSAVA